MRRNKFDCGYSFDIDSGEIFEHGNEHGFSCYKGNPLKKLENSVKKTIASPSRLVTSATNVATGGMYGLATGKKGALGGLDSLPSTATNAIFGGLVGKATQTVIDRKYAQDQKDSYEAKLFDMQANSLASQTNIANQQELRSQEQYGEYKKTYAPAETRLAADIQGKYQNQNNASMNQFINSNTANVNSLNSGNTSLTNNYNKQLGDTTNAHNASMKSFEDNAAGQTNKMAGDYNNQIMGYANDMGKADTDILGRTKANAYAGVDTGFSNAQKQMQADLARRGMGNSGIFAKASMDLAGARAADYSARGVGAHNDAVAQSDGRRGSQIQTAGAGYGARNTAMTQGFGNNRNQMNSGFANNLSSLGSQFSNSMSDNTNRYNANTGLNANNYTAQTANTQQSISNMTGLAQLGRGMQSTSQNYLGQAGSTFGQNAQISGQTALGIGNQQVALQSAQMQAQAQKDAGKGAMTGSIVGAGITGAAMMSDERLKENIKAAGEFYGYSFYTWDWNDDGLRLADPDQPTFGVMAQEVRRINPRAVTMADDGYYRVDYNMIMGGAL